MNGEIGEFEGIDISLIGEVGMIDVRKRRSGLHQPGTHLRDILGRSLHSTLQNPTSYHTLP